MPLKTKKKERKQKKTTESNRSIADARIEKYYNKIVVGFISATVLLILVILYFSFSKTTISITTENTDKEISFNATIQELGGTVLLTDIEDSKTANGTSNVVTSQGRASGTVTLINNYSADQPLVATTRLLSENGVLFRTQESVVVPAGGTVDVPVLADTEGESGDIEPTKFEIVALRENLKPSIYGQSTAAMTGGLIKTAVLSEEDITQAKTDLTNALLTEAKNRFKEKTSAADWSITNTKVIVDPYVLATKNESVSAKAGDEVDSFAVTENLTIAEVVIDLEKLKTLYQTKLTTDSTGELLPVTDTIFDQAKFSVSNLSADYTDGDVKIEITAPVKLALTDSALAPKNFTNKTEAEVKTLLNQIPGVDQITIKFFPFWSNKTPGLESNIKIVLQ
ncbi:MAG: hypothetical protein A2233_02960 [Candidatus Kerfeldbacteria bacterium RIFOXYA2_FULL_38_24]|uniref:Baseplate protein J-like barrel domain-containing protein n=1 Tax=Candidatus Kerfeldbacteria bacterium RIFOXYB2_FULL_38_14 TaxID=1798547 RepID=A0A1G2BDF7_9BACT|nr:MAG: hypothetical protein A2319_05635 [Candidatus Kerfeldbacteria bacterium RIFOXYB2_FULL_38_14]OGY86495.1 MAG: hypothetical protein A2233_02960 [Candidatus Kerfeldbacteria bacterium RIFOXYA2_FULL_38_24]